MDKSKIIIDKEFRDKLGKLSDDEFKQLEENILQDGTIHDPLIVWMQPDGTGILIDGHNRYAIAQKHGLDFKVEEKEFPGRWDVIVWICQHQLGRRNLNEPTKAKLVQELYESMQKSVGAPIGNNNAATNNQLGNSCPIDSNEKNKANSTRAKIAKETGMSERTVQNHINAGRGMDNAESVEPGFTQAVLAGTVKASNKDLAALRKKKGEDLKQAIQDLKDGKKLQSQKPIPEEQQLSKEEIDKYVREKQLQGVSEAKQNTIEDADGFFKSDIKRFIESITRDLMIYEDVIETKDGKDMVIKNLDECINLLNDIKKGVKQFGKT